MGNKCAKEEAVDQKCRTGSVAEIIEEMVPLQGVSNEVKPSVEATNVERKNIEHGGEDESKNKEPEEEMNNEIAQLWEECFDLSEVLGTLTEKAKRYNENFWDDCYDGVKAEAEENWTRFTELLGVIVKELEQVSMDEIVYGLQETAFSKKEAKDGEVACSQVKSIPFARYLEASRDTRQSSARILGQAFDLFFHSINMHQEVKKDLLIERSFYVWSHVYTFHTGLQAIIEKFLVYLTDEEALPFVHSTSNQGSTSLPSAEKNNKDILSVLNLSVKIVKRKQLDNTEGAGELMRKVIELRDILSIDL